MRFPKLHDALLLSIALIISLASAQILDPSLFGPTSCRNPIVYNTSSIDVLSKCTTVGGSLRGLIINAAINGPIAIAGVSVVNTSIEILGDGLYRPDYPNITTFEMPDLEKVTGGIGLVDVDKLTKLSLPKLNFVGGPIMFNSLGGPSLNVSLPALEEAVHSVYILGNIDVIQLPLIQSIGAISINSTGNLDCSSLSKVLDQCTITIGHDSMICYGKNNAVIGTFVDTTPTGSEPMASSTSASQRLCSSTFAGITTSADGSTNSVEPAQTSVSTTPTQSANSAVRNGVRGTTLLMATLGFTLLF